MMLFLRLIEEGVIQKQRADAAGVKELYGGV